MRRGDLVTVALSGGCGKPCPALVIQSNLFVDHPSVTILPLTSQVHTVARDKIRETIGFIGDMPLIEIERAVAVWLGIAD